MSTSELKLSIIQLISSINDESKLNNIYQTLIKGNQDWYDTLSDEAKSSINKGIEDADNSNFVSYEDVQSKVDKLLGR